MAIDFKYGKVTVEFPGPEENEPVIVFRAQDQLVPELLQHYRQLCEAAGSPDHHLEAIDVTKWGIEEWQAKHPDQVRVPNSNRWAERTGRV